MVDDIPGVVKLVPVPRLAPPDEAAYQLMVPAEAVAPNTTVPVPHRPAGAMDVIVGTVLIVAITAVRDPVVQPLAVASTK